MWLKSSDDKFFKAFGDIVERAEKASVLLRDMVADPTKIETHAKQIRALEHEADDVVRGAMRALRATWITPFDRADIHQLVSRLDDVLDVIHSLGARFELFELKEIPSFVCEFAELIVSACAEIRKAVALLNDMKKSDQILKHTEEVERLESEGDRLFRRALADLYNSGGDPITVMKWREMYDKLESVLDLLSDAGDAIEGVVLEYA